MMMQKISIQLHADDIIYKPEDIAELEEYLPDQREAMVAAIMKEIGDLINDFAHSSFGNFGGMGNKGEREDFQSPSSGGALF